MTAANPSSHAHTDVVVVGAGPYGLSIAALLRAARVPTYTFGEALSFWREHMPKGMKLRSPWRKTHIAEPISELSLDTCFAGRADVSRSAQLPLEQFQEYGAWVQKRVAPDLDGRRITQIEATDSGFRLHLNDGSIMNAKRVVMAPGLCNQEFRPAEFEGLPKELVSHSADHTDLGAFRGRKVAVIGRGQSACESSALLHEAGVDVELICRGPVQWHGDPSKKSALKKGLKGVLGDLLTPPSQVGAFPLNWLAEAPGMLHTWSDAARDWMNRSCLGATAALWLRDRNADVPQNSDRTIQAVRRNGDRVDLVLDNGTRTFDHVLLATGYRIDLGKLGLFEPRLLQRIACRNGLPVLSSGFESSVPGLYFAGSYAVGSFGPLLRFIAGSGFAASTIARAIAAKHKPAEMPDDEWLPEPRRPLARQ